MDLLLRLGRRCCLASCPRAAKFLTLQVVPPSAVSLQLLTWQLPWEGRQPFTVGWLAGRLAAVTEGQAVPHANGVQEQ